MRTKPLFVKPTPLVKRLWVWTVPLILLVFIWPSSDPVEVSIDSLKQPPIEPPGSVLVTPIAVDVAIVKALPVLSDMPPSSPEASKAPAPNLMAVAQVEQIEKSSHAALLNALEQWRSAWETQNLPAYLASYGDDFVPAQKMSRQAWAKLRTARIGSKQTINLTLKDLNVTKTDQNATVTFTQIYVDERLRLTDRKTLVWQKKEGVWLIQHESTA